MIVKTVSFIKHVGLKKKEKEKKKELLLKPENRDIISF